MLRKCFIIAASAIGALSACGDSPETYGPGGSSSTAGNPFVTSAAESEDIGNGDEVAGEAQATPASTPSPTPTPRPTPTPQIFSSLVINDFLWKPVSESDGKLVVLINPTNIRAEVTGDISENLRNHGPSNGRGSTLRGSFSGCEYGSEVKVEFFDSAGRRVLIRDERKGVIIENGCERVEFRL